MKKLIAFISLFFLAAFPALAADGTFSVTSYTYNDSTHVVHAVATSFSSTPDNSISFSFGVPPANDPATNLAYCLDTVTSATTMIFDCTLDQGTWFPSYGTNGIFQMYDGTTFFKTSTFDLAASSSTPTPTPAVAGISIDPTVQAHLNAGIGSLGTIVIHQVVFLLPIILPLIAIFFIVNFAINFFRRRANEEMDREG